MPSDLIWSASLSPQKRVDPPPASWRPADCLSYPRIISTDSRAVFVCLLKALAPRFLRVVLPSTRFAIYSMISREIDSAQIQILASRLHAVWRSSLSLGPAAQF